MDRRIDIRELNRRAVLACGAAVAAIPAGALGGPTPCAGWTLGDLLAHLTVQHNGFARAVAGEATELADWRPAPPGADPVGAYRAAADRVLAAFAAPGALERTCFLPEIRGGVTVPVPLAISFHFVDHVVHGWDVATSIGVPIEFDPEVLAAALEVAALVPGGDARLAPGAAFGPDVAAAPDAPPLDRLLAALGRSPAWRP